MLNWQWIGLLVSMLCFATIGSWHLIIFSLWWLHFGFHTLKAMGSLSFFLEHSLGDVFDVINTQVRSLVPSLVESDAMWNLCKCYVTKLCKTYVNESYIALTRSYVVSMPGLCFLYRKCYVFASQTEPT